MQLIKRSSNSSEYHYFICDPTTDYLSEACKLEHIIYADDPQLLSKIKGQRGLKEYFESQHKYEVIIQNFDWPLTAKFLQINYPELLL